MFSRRSLIAWLGIAPVAAAVAWAPIAHDKREDAWHPQPRPVTEQ
jgi:hypothetical protein